MVLLMIKMMIMNNDSEMIKAPQYKMLKMLKLDNKAWIKSSWKCKWNTKYSPRILMQ